MTVNELLAIFGAAGMLVGGAWALVKIVVVQFEKRLDERFEGLEESRKEGQGVWDERFKGMEGRLTVQEMNLSSMLTALPIHYTRREDSIRADVQVNAKLDAINSRLDQWLNRWNQERKS